MFPIELTAPDTHWAESYADMERRLNEIMDDLRPTIWHVGSTAIRGIWAKPIVDVLAELDNERDLKTAARLLSQNGFIVMSSSESRISLNLGYTERGFAERVYHIHLRLRGDREEVYFRDYLNAHPDIAKEYETLKLGLWKQYEFDRDGYTRAKTEFVTEHTLRARDECACHNDK